ncbi:MAG: hypothetical protein ACQESH_07390 [Campylobacterota bacterium]
MNIKKYAYYLIVIIVIGIVSVEMYNQLNPTKAKSQRLACHEGVTVFERINNEGKITALQEAIKAGNITVEPRIQKSEYMQSQLFTHITQEQIEKKIYDRFVEEKTDASSEHDVVIDLLVYENDKEDPKKKNEAAKKYAGYIHLKYLLDESVVYRFQIDFMDMQARDLDDRIDCAVQSVMSL